MADRLKDRVAVITGTGGGIGRAAALLFAQEGATVVGSDYDRTTGSETVEMVRARGGRMVSHNDCDLTDPAMAQDLVDLAIKEYGRIDVLYNSAAKGTFASIEDMTPEKFRKGIVDELDLVFYLCRAAWPKLIATGGGSIVNTGSKSGLRGNPMIGNTAHAASKGAVIALTRQLAIDGAPHGIRANSISPAIVRTKQTESVLSNEKWRIEATSRIPLRRVGEPEDVAYAALFLASDEARWITGTDLVVDGGATAW